MGDTSISWTDKTWNPIRGCSRVSEGCRNCYAEAVAARFSGPGQAYEGLADRTRKGSKWTGVVRLIGEHLEDPLRWQKPRRIFVNSMSDLFHEQLADEEIDQVFAVMLLAPRHTFQVLTKRAARMRQYMTNPTLYERILRAASDLRILRPELDQVGIGNPTDSPARWIWLGVSVENQAAGDERIPELLATPAAVRFLSCEPLLGPVTLDGGAVSARGSSEDWLRGVVPRIAWVIAGCESGHGARECRAAWLQSLRDQCGAARVAFFLKQAVEELGELDDKDKVCPECGERVRYHVCGSRDTLASCGCTAEGPEACDWHPPIGRGDGSKEKGRGFGGPVLELPYLDGVQHAEFPR